MFPPANHIDRTDPARLDEHLRQCAFARGPMHRLHCVAEALHAFLAPRFVTTLVLLTVVVVGFGVTLPA